MSFLTFPVTGNYKALSPGGVVNGNVKFTPNVLPGVPPHGATGGTTFGMIPEPTTAVIANGVLLPTSTYAADVTLYSNDPQLNLSGALQYTVDFSDVTADGVLVRVDPFTFNAPADSTPVDLIAVSPGSALQIVNALPTLPVSGLSDATTYGKGFLTGPTDAASARTYLGIGGSGNEAEYFANLAAFPGTGDTTKEYVAKDTGKIYYWNGSAYIQFADKNSVGLGNADNTSDVNKPVSTAQQAALDLKGDILTAAAAVVTASTAPAIGKITLYNATSGNLTPSLPALSGLSVGARLAVRRDPAEVSANTVTFSTNGGDTFYSSGATSFTLPIGGEQREFQVISVSSTKYWAPAGSLNPITGLGRVFGTQNRGNIGIWFGDSIGTAQDMIVGSANLVDPTIRSESTFAWASILSGQRLRYFRNASKGGDNAATAMARWTTDVAPYNFSVLIWALGTNDSFLQTTVAAYAAQVKEAHARTRAKGADFIICTIPPNDNLSGSPANRKSLIVQYNQFLRDYAAKWGLILIDMFDLLSDTSGNYASGYSTDKTHPIAVGYRAMGALVADTLALYLPPFSAPLPRTTTDANLLTEPLFLGGLNGSFVPTGWSMPSGVLRTGVTASLVTTDTDIKGNWYKFVVANTFSGPQTIFQTISSGITAGRQYRFIGRIKMLNPVGITITARIAYDANFDYTGDATNTHEFRAMSGLGGAIPSGVFWFDSIAPTSASTAQINIQIVGNGGTGEVHLAQIGVYDITDVQAAL